MREQVPEGPCVGTSKYGELANKAGITIPGAARRFTDRDETRRTVVTGPHLNSKRRLRNYGAYNTIGL